MTRQSFVIVSILSVLFAACGSEPIVTPDGGAGGAAWTGQFPSPICGSDPKYAGLCPSGEIPYCYEPAGEVGPRPFADCSAVSADGGAATDGNGNASVWCCLYNGGAQ